MAPGIAVRRAVHRDSEVFPTRRARWRTSAASFDSVQRASLGSSRWPPSSPSAARILDYRDNSAPQHGRERRLCRPPAARPLHRGQRAPPPPSSPPPRNLQNNCAAPAPRPRLASASRRCSSGCGSSSPTTRRSPSSTSPSRSGRSGAAAAMYDARSHAAPATARRRGTPRWRTRSRCPASSRHRRALARLRPPRLRPHAPRRARVPAYAAAPPRRAAACTAPHRPARRRPPGRPHVPPARPRYAAHDALTSTLDHGSATAASTRPSTRSRRASARAGARRTRTTRTASTRSTSASSTTRTPRTSTARRRRAPEGEGGGGDADEVAARDGDDRVAAQHAAGLAWLADVGDRLEARGGGGGGGAWRAATPPPRVLPTTTPHTTPRVSPCEAEMQHPRARRGRGVRE